MTLDEAIAHAKELSENQYMVDLDRENFKQLAAWLEELKQYKEQNQPEKTVIEKEKPQREENQPGKTVIEKEKPAKEALTLFSVEVLLTSDAEDNMQLETYIKGSRPEMRAFLETMDVNPEELGSILKHAAKAMLKDFIQQVVNLSESLEGAEMEETED